jgi:hypothetical protein
MEETMKANEEETMKAKEEEEQFGGYEDWWIWIWSTKVKASASDLHFCTFFDVFKIFLGIKPLIVILHVVISIIR